MQRVEVTTADLDALESELGHSLPPDVRRLLLAVGDIDVVGDEDHPDGSVYLLGPSSMDHVFEGSYRKAIDDTLPPDDRSPAWAPLRSARRDIRPLLCSGYIEEPLVGVSADGLRHVHISGASVQPASEPFEALVRAALERLVVYE